jgi:hypothetical protein
MAKLKDVNDPASVSEFIQKLDPEFAELVQAIHKVILSTDKVIGEQIKWNSPSFFYTGDMKPFDPKEYKRDIVVMNLRKGVVLLVFPTGATVKDSSGILEGNYPDGRRMVTFRNIAEVKAKSKNLQAIIKLWLKQVEKI